jgi:hypothetical protein
VVGSRRKIQEAGEVVCGHLEVVEDNQPQQHKANFPNLGLASPKRLELIIESMHRGPSTLKTYQGINNSPGTRDGEPRYER